MLMSGGNPWALAPLAAPGSMAASCASSPANSGSQRINVSATCCARSRHTNAASADSRIRINVTRLARLVKPAASLSLCRRANRMLSGTLCWLAMESRRACNAAGSLATPATSTARRGTASLPALPDGSSSSIFVTTS